MNTSIVIAGFGGQGVLYAGKLLAYAGMEQGYNVTWIPSYGPEMRGGTANCTVVISDAPIGAPLVAQPDIVLALNQPSYDKYVSRLAPNGLLLVNSSLVANVADRAGVQVEAVPMNRLAEAAGSVRMLNMVAVASLLQFRPILTPSAVEAAFLKHPPTNNQAVIDQNLKLFHSMTESIFETV